MNRGVKRQPHFPSAEFQHAEIRFLGSYSIVGKAEMITMLIKDMSDIIRGGRGSGDFSLKHSLRSNLIISQSLCMLD